MKDIHCVELSHHKADLPTREKFFLRLNQIGGPIDQLKAVNDEIFIISTCNRLAVYTFGNSINQLVDSFSKENVTKDQLDARSGDEAVLHLFRTAGGLESQELGEHQILGQIRKSMDIAMDEKRLGPIANQLISRSIHTGRRVRAETKIGQYSASLPATSVNTIEKITSLTNSKILVIGTGEMSRLILQLLTKKEAPYVHVYSRSSARAKKIASEFMAEAVHEDDLLQAIDTSDVIVGATSSSTPLFEASQIKTNGEPKLFIDLGMPRNFDEEIGNTANVQLLDLDDMKSLTRKNIQKREREVPKAEQIIKEEVGAFMEWYNARKVAPEINHYCKKLKEIEEEEFKKVIQKLANLDEKERSILQKYTHTLLKRVSKNPIETIRKYSQNTPNGAAKIEAFREIFDIA